MDKIRTDTYLVLLREDMINALSKGGSPVRDALEWFLKLPQDEIDKLTEEFIMDIRDPRFQFGLSELYIPDALIEELIHMDHNRWELDRRVNAALHNWKGDEETTA